MKLIICLDKKNGLAFNKRRQTRDKEQRKHMYNLVANSCIRINPYSFDLLSSEIDAAQIIASEDYLDAAGEDDFVFAEIDDAGAYADKIDVLYAYKWNRMYLSDIRFDAKIFDCFTCVRKEKIKGSSHEKITFEEYRKKTE